MQNEKLLTLRMQILLLPQCFQIAIASYAAMLSTLIHKCSNIYTKSKFAILLPRHFRGHLLQLLLYAVNPFLHTTNLQQTTLNIFCQKIENLLMDNQRLKVENILSKGEIACFKQFLLLTLYMFSKSRLLKRR